MCFKTRIYYRGRRITLINVSQINLSVLFCLLFKRIIQIWTNWKCGSPLIVYLIIYLFCLFSPWSFYYNDYIYFNFKTNSTENYFLVYLILMQYFLSLLFPGKPQDNQVHIYSNICNLPFNWRFLCEHDQIDWVSSKCVVRLIAKYLLHLTEWE